MVTMRMQKENGEEIDRYDMQQNLQPAMLVVIERALCIIF